jgi:hypothetical protein
VKVKKIRWKKSPRRRKGWPASTGFLNDHVIVSIVFDPELQKWHRVCFLNPIPSGSHKTEELAKKKSQSLFEKFILDSLCKEK